MKNVFDVHWKRYDAWYRRNKFAYLSELEAIKKVLPKAGRGLEIGVGTGRFASALGVSVGIDPSKNTIEVARQRGVDARLGSGEHLPFRDATFDYAAIIITLGFVKDPQKVLKEARRVLKKEGKIIIGMVDKDSFLGRIYQKKKSVFYKEAHFFSVRDVSDLLKATGFSKFSYHQTIFGIPNKINSIEKPKSGFGDGGFAVISAKKSTEAKSGIYRKFNQHKRVRFLFKRYGYDIEGARRKVVERAGEIKEPVLDVGTGPGRMACTLACAGHKVTTIDVSKEALNIARIYARRYRVMDKIRFMKMDAQNMKFKNGNFATVISANLLHDVKDAERVVHEILRVTQPGGKIVISDLNHKGKILVNKVYRINNEVHRSEPVDMKRVVGENLKNKGIRCRRYIDGFITTYVGEKVQEQEFVKRPKNA